MYINDLPDCLKSNVSLFADDCVVYRPVATSSDCESLQSDLKQLERWEKKWMMSFKTDKCFILRFTRKKTYKIEYSYKLSGHYLQPVNHHKYLGVMLSTDRKWNTHFDKITSKANSMLGFARRNLGSAPRKVKIQAYKSLVRPHVEYCSSVWDPHTNRNIQKIEAIQRPCVQLVSSRITTQGKALSLPCLRKSNYHHFKIGA